MKSESGNREWLDEFMSLKQVNPNNPFTVPPGYFDESEQQIISAIKLDELKTGKGFAVPENYFDALNNNIQSRINLEGLRSENEFSVPQDYFDELSSNIQSRINLEELRSENDFAVPQNYFDELSSNILSRINIEEYVNNDEHGHTVPQEYFNNFEEQINARILVEETMGAEESFSVPAGYFEGLNKAILNKTVNQDMVKRKSQGIVRRMYATNTFKYAVAACFAVLVGGTLVISRYTDTTTDHNSTFLHKQLSTVSTSDIQSYLQDDVDPTDVQRTVIDENTPVNTNSLTKALQSDNDTDN